MTTRNLQVALPCLSLCLCTTGWLNAQDPPPAGRLAASEQKKEGPETADPPPRSLPLDVAGYLSFRTLHSASLNERFAYREYAGSIFLSKSAGPCQFHSEFNARSAPSGDSDGIYIFPRRGDLSVQLDSALLNYNWRDWLQAEAGFLFVPTYWRTHGYQSTTLTVDEPLIDENIFPTALKCVMIHGDKYFEEGGISYQIYGGITQARHFSAGPEDPLDHSRAGGAKLVLHLPSRRFFDVFDVGYQRLHELYPGIRHDQSNGWELRVKKHRVEFLAEVAHSSIRPVNGTRGHFREGYYVQPSYRVTRKLIAVSRYDFLNRDDRRASRNALARQSLGLTSPPWQLLSLKFEVDRYQPERGRLPAYYGASVGVVYFFHLP